MNEELNTLSASVEEKLFSIYDNISTGGLENSLFMDESVLTDLEFDELFTDKNLHAQGGCKNIYKVKNQHAGRYVAMAELRQDASVEMAEYFYNEARITAALEHPNIVPVYHVGLNADKLPFFTMKFLKDESLSKIVKEFRKGNNEYIEKFPQSELLDIFVKICDAVAYAHSKGIIHLDLKPENVMIGDYGEVYVCDWGLAKQIDGKEKESLAFSKREIETVSPITVTGTIKGTPGYMAPEQVSNLFGEKDEKSDIYALGALLYTILTHHIPFEGRPFNEVVKLTAKGDFKVPTEVDGKISESLNAVVVKAMALKKSDRYSYVDEIVDEIKSYQSGFATSAEKASFLKSFYLLLRRHKNVSLLLAVIITLSISSVVTLKGRERRLDQAVKQFKSEQQLRREQLVKTAPALIDQWHTHPSLMNLDWMHQQLDQLILSGSHVEDAKQLKFYLYLSHLEFDKALSVAKISKGKSGELSVGTVKQISALCRDGLKQHGYIPRQIGMRCLDVNNFSSYNSSHAKVFAGKIFSQLLTDQEKGRFVRNCLKIWGRQKHFDSIDIVTTEKGVVTVNFSDMDIEKLDGIEEFPIDILKLCNIPSIDYPEYGMKHVRKLDLSRVERVRTLRGLRYQPNLEYVVLPVRKRGSSIEDYLKTSKIKYKISDE